MLVDTSLQKQDQSQNLMPMLGDFHTAECMQHSIQKYIRGSALEESLRQARVFELNIADSVLDGMHYVITHSRDCLFDKCKRRIELDYIH